MPLTALSISRPVIHSMEAALRSDSPSTWQVLAVLERACYLVSPAGDLMALVLGEIGDGPLNVVVAATPGAFGRLTTGMACDLSARGLRLGNIAVDLAAAQIWEPRPDWHRLRDRLAQVQRLLGELRTVAHRSAPAGSLLSLLSGCARSHDRLEESVRLAARQAGDALRAGWSGDERHRQMAAAQLAGLGQGLTPAGNTDAERIVQMALAMAGAVGTMTCSPTPRAPHGPSSRGVSTNSPWISPGCPSPWRCDSPPGWVQGPTLVVKA
jgi:hypothetical protein